MVYIFSLPMMPAVVLSFLSSQVPSLMQSYKSHELYFTGMIPVVLWYMNARSYVDMELPLPPLNFLRSFLSFALPNNVRIYIETAIVVVISYMSLLIVNWSYIWLVVFPVIAVGFIAALCSELSHQSGSQRQSDDSEASLGRKSEGLEAAALVPYWALCVMGQFHADKFAVSQFLLFFSFMLGALTMMMSRLALTTIAAHRGVGPASELLRKASLVVLLVAVHALAAELLGQNVALFCLPEIAPVLLWFSVHLDGDDGSGDITAAEIKLVSRVLAVLGAAAAAALALLANYMDESVLHWCTKALVSCGVSGLLVYYLVFLLCQWPGQNVAMVTPFGKEAARLLRSWANVLLTAASTLLITSLLVAARVVLQESMVAESGSQILRRICEKFLEFIV